ncbi:MAG TPA: serine/threonine-protein phosphatase [Nanoarchaeota archaeon]|nr:serine/threonine-protein phosphatase [Nanoarchaeota archaeon]
MKVYGLSVKGKHHEENEDCYLINVEKKLFAVADGVSIPKGGKQASYFTMKFLNNFFNQNLKQAIEIVNEKIFELRSKNICGFTTLTALHIKNNKAQLCWIGDSPAFLIRANKIFLLTSFEDVHENMLLQAIGSQNINIHEKIFEIKKGDKIILCTDGISSVLSENEILYIALKYNDAEKICKNLIKIAEKMESVYKDDKTVITILL